MRADASLEIGSAAPQFDALLGADGEQYSLSSFDGVPVLVVMFLSNGCPTVAGYKDRLRGIAQEYGNRGIQLVAIYSNSPYVSPRDAYSEMVDRGREFGLDFPYLKDKDGKMARDYGAVCTPHVFVFNEARLLCYTGRIDDSRLPGNVTSHDLRNALEDLLVGRPVSVARTRPFGCAIVW